MKVFISAAEASSDLHAAKLVAALKKECAALDLPLEVMGLGGPALKSEGFRQLAEASELLVMGFAEAVSRLGAIKRNFEKLVTAIRAESPDLVILMDYPEFHFKLRRAFLDANAIQAKWIYYILPKIWVWREGRATFLRENFALLASILPFEEEFFSRHGTSIRYFGNPLLDELPLELSRESARDKLGFEPDEKVVLAMPGSRPSELKLHLELVLDAGLRLGHALKTRDPRQKVRVHLAFSEMLRKSSGNTDAMFASRRTEFEKAGLILSSSIGDAPECMRAADFGLIKSGTSTLEAALLDLPHVLFYRAAPLSAFLFKFVVKFTGPVGLVNLIFSKGTKQESARVTPEILLGAATAERLAHESLRILEPAATMAQRTGFARVREILKGTSGEGPSQSLAKELVRLCRR